jgi:hypothetical protein
MENVYAHRQPSAAAFGERNRRSGIVGNRTNRLLRRRAGTNGTRRLDDGREFADRVVR